jgi:hypothetical protein
MSTRNKNRLPPPRGDAVVLISQIAQALGWSTARLRKLDDLLKPMRLADGNGTRAYHVDRALMFVDAVDGPVAWSAAKAAERAGVKAAREWRAQRRRAAVKRKAKAAKRRS